MSGGRQSEQPHVAAMLPKMLELGDHHADSGTVDGGNCGQINQNLYALARHKPRPLRRLYGKRQAMMDQLIREYRSAIEFRDQRAEEASGRA